MKSASFEERSLPVGDKLYWMLFRSHGKVKVAQDIEWAGKAPLDVFAFTVPARHVGGDCYDVMQAADHLIAVSIGDVAGKGAPAALLMANVQASLRAIKNTVFFIYYASSEIYSVVVVGCVICVFETGVVT